MQAGEILAACLEFKDKNKICGSENALSAFLQEQSGLDLETEGALCCASQ